MKQMTPEVRMHLFLFANIIKQFSSNLPITNLNDFNLDACGPLKDWLRLPAGFKLDIVLSRQWCGTSN